jgi:uncharacterized protein (TIGR02757 family)
VSRGATPGQALDKKKLEALYERYNRKEYLHPDPLEFLYNYEDDRDREIVGLIASALAYGRVAQIVKSVAAVLDRMPSPRAFLERSSPDRMRRSFADFRHRFTTGEELAAVLLGAKRVIERYGSLRRCFAGGLIAGDDTVLPALSAFVAELTDDAGGAGWSLLPLPGRGSACKRLHLFLRWMVRRDEVDPGGWDEVPRAKLIVPLDTHMHRIGRHLGLTGRKQADLRAALETTRAFRTIRPDDPVRYDFALSRLGIRADADLTGFLCDYGRPLKRGEALRKTAL